MFSLSHRVLDLHHASINSKLVVISAVLASMMLAEQYLSWLMAMRAPIDALVRKAHSFRMTRPYGKPFERCDAYNN